MGLACAVACIARLRPRLGVLFLALAWALVPSAPATPAPATASTSATGPVLSALVAAVVSVVDSGHLAIGERGLLAHSGRDVDRLLRKLFAHLRAQLRRFIGLACLWPRIIAFAVAAGKRPLPATMLAVGRALFIPLVAPAAAPAPAARATPDSMLMAVRSTTLCVTGAAERSIAKLAPCMRSLACTAMVTP